MNFNNIIKTNFSELLDSFGFKIVEEIKGLVIYKSDLVSLRFFNNSYSFEYGYFVKINDSNFEYEGQFVEGFLKIIDEPVFSDANNLEKIENWAEHKLKFFKKYSDKILLGDKTFYSELNNYFENQTEDYNKKLNP